MSSPLSQGDLIRENTIFRFNRGFVISYGAIAKLLDDHDVAIGFHKVGSSPRDFDFDLFDLAHEGILLPH